MWWAPIAAAGVSALGNIAGGLFGGGGKGKQGDAENFARQQLETQMQKSVQWRVADARAAGVHPLAALGAQVSASPATPVGGDSNSDRYNLGASLADVGQSIVRAIGTKMSDQERDAATMRALELEEKGLSNEALRFQLQQMRNSVAPPPDHWSQYGGVGGPIGGSRPSAITVRELNPAESAAGMVKTEPSERKSHAQGYPHQEAAASPENQWMRTAKGYVAMPSTHWNMDDSGSPGTVGWLTRNRLYPAIPYQAVKSMTPPRDERGVSLLPKGAKGWIYDPITTEWTPTYEERSLWHPYFIPDGRLERR